MTNLSRTMLTVLATGLLTCGLFSQQARAFNGSIGFSGTASASGNSTPFTTTDIFFSNDWIVLTSSGAYSGQNGQTALMSNFSFTGTGTAAVLAPGGDPITPEWSFTGLNGSTYTFDLYHLISGTVTAGTMSLSGTGIAYINGIHPTVARWTLVGTMTGFKFDLSSASTTTVPDGGSAVALLGIAFAGIEVVRRKMKAKDA